MSKETFYITNPDIEQYAEEHCTQESDILQKINRETHLRSAMPQMLSGHLQGAFLGMISKLVKPFKVIEIGTFMGYSAICLAEGLAKGGKIITIDNNPEILDVAGKYFQEAGLEEVIEIRLGEAIEILPGLEGPFDIVYIDADKENYLTYYNLVIDKLWPGGVILADNTLWYGRVIDPQSCGDFETDSIRAFNRQILNDQRVESLLMPVRDGLTLIRKL